MNFFLELANNLKKAALFEMVKLVEENIVQTNTHKSYNGSNSLL